MFGSSLKQLYGKLDMPIKKLFGAAVISSFGAPVTFVLIVVVSSIVHEWKDLDSFKVTSMFGLSLLVSLICTLTVTVLVFLIAKVFRLKSVNVGLASLICLFIFACLTVIGVDFRDAPDLRMQFSAVGLATVNVFLFMLLAYKQSELSELML